MEKEYDHGLAQGTILDSRYEIIRILDRDNFCTSYLAVNRRVGRNVVIKELLQGIAAFSERKQDFMKAARIMGDFGSEQGLAGVTDYFEENGTVYVVTNDSTGDTLAEYARNHEKISPEDFMKRLLPVIRSLRKLHKANIIYRYICPENVIVTESDTLKLKGFTEEMYADEESLISFSEGTFDESMLHPYFAWEQFEAPDKTGPWTDVYGLCMLVCEYLTGEVPPGALERILFDSWESRNLSGAGISPELEKILKKGMKVNPEERYQSMEELQGALEAWLPAPPKKRRIYKKAVAACVLVCLMAGLAAVGRMYYKNNEEKFKFRGIKTETTVVLLDEDITAREYYDAMELIRKKMDIFAGEENYILREKENQAEIIVPLSLYGGESVDVVINRDIFRPLMINMWTGEGGVIMERGDIVSLKQKMLQKQKEGTPEETESIIYWELKITDEAAGMLEKALERAGGYKSENCWYELEMEYMDYSRFCGRYEVSEDRKTCYLHTQYDLPKELKEFETACSRQTYYVFCEIPVEWEEKSIISGENQCSEKEISQPSVSVEYECNADDNEKIDQRGYWYHTIYEYKRFLDILQIPYAFGVSPDDRRRIIVKAAQKDFPIPYALLTGSYSLEMYDEEGDYISYFTTDALDIHKNKDGTYSLKLIAESKEYLEKSVKEHLKQGRKKVFLILNGYGSPGEERAIAECELDESMTAGEIVFTKSLLNDGGVFTEEDIPFLNLLKEKEENHSSFDRYYVRNIQYSSAGYVVDTKAAVD